MRDAFQLGYEVKMAAGSDDTGEVKLYGQIISNIPENWKWDIEDKSATDFDNEIKKLKDDGAKKLLLRINSPGGIVSQAVAMRSILANAEFDEINIRIEGMCASAATIIAALPGAHVQIAEGSQYMIHDPYTYAAGSAEELESTAKCLRNIEDMIRNIYTKRTGLSDDDVKQMMDKETWFSAKEAVENHFCDEVVDVEPKQEPAACVSSQIYAAMKVQYRNMPTDIGILKPDPEGEGDGGDPMNDAGSGTPKAGEPAGNIHHKEDEQMELKDITIEQLSSERPDLLDAARNEAVKAERDRLSDIDALTVPGYEDMAEKAKKDGTSAIDFQKSLVKAMKEKGSTFMAQRAAETAPAQDVPGTAPASGKTEEQEIKDNAKEVAEYAKEYSGFSEGGMY